MSDTDARGCFCTDESDYAKRPSLTQRMGSGIKRTARRGHVVHQANPNLWEWFVTRVEATNTLLAGCAI
jgi:hypothetical protein